MRGLLRREFRLAALAAINVGLADIAARLALLVDRRRGVALLGQVASIRKRRDDHTAYWDAALLAYPDEARFIRGKVEAALRSGKIGDAEQGFALLVDARRTTYADWKFVVGLCQVDHCRGDWEAIRGRIRAYLKSLRGTSDYRIAAVKLSRLIFAHFPRNGRSSFDPEHCRVRFLGMLRRSAVRTSPRRILERVVGLETSLSSGAARAILDTDLSPFECRRFIRIVHDAMAGRQPFSFLRIGDGEAACLTYEPKLAPLARIDAADRERIWWGNHLSRRVRMRMAPKIASAMWNADCIGIPATARFLRELELTKEDTLDTKLTGRGLRAILYNAERYRQIRSPMMPPPVFTSCHLHQELERWNLYGELLDGAVNVVLISCHAGLADWMAGKFGIGIRGNILLPPDRVSGPMLRNGVSESRVLPEILEDTIDKIAGLAANSLVLVGAGYPGKVLADAARRHGGVALDLGSIFDYWLGINTRSYLDLRPL